MEKIKVNKKMVERFLQIMESYGEFVFYDSIEYLKKHLETVLNSQGYWAGNCYRIYYNKETKDFTIQPRF